MCNRHCWCGHQAHGCRHRVDAPPPPSPAWPPRSSQRYWVATTGTSAAHARSSRLCARVQVAGKHARTESWDYASKRAGQSAKATRRPPVTTAGGWAGPAALCTCRSVSPAGPQPKSRVPALNPTEDAVYSFKIRRKYVKNVKIRRSRVRCAGLCCHLGMPGMAQIPRSDKDWPRRERRTGSKERPPNPAKSPGPQRDVESVCHKALGWGPAPRDATGTARRRLPGFSLCKPQAPESSQARCVLGRHLQTHSWGGRPVGGSRPLPDNFYRFPF